MLISPVITGVFENSKTGLQRTNFSFQKNLSKNPLNTVRNADKTTKLKTRCVFTIILLSIVNVMVKEDDLEVFQMKKFDLSSIPPASTVLLLGGRGSGKSFLLRDILYHNKRIPQGLIYSSTEEANRFFGDFFPDTFIHSKYNKGLIEKSFRSQKKKVGDCKKLNKGDKGRTPGNRFLCVLDDMLADAHTWKNDETIKDMFYNGRHYNFFFVLTMQYALGIPPGLRGNIDYVFIFNEPSIKSRKKIWEDYAGMIPSYDVFSNILDSCTQDYGCMVVKRKPSHNLNEQVFHYRASDHPPFRVGHPKIWQFHEQNYNKNYQEEEEFNDLKIDKLKKKYKKTNKLKILVNKETNSIVEVEESSL